MIQTFPEDFNFDGTKTDIEQMIGNAVPVNLGTYVAKVILEKAGEKDAKDLSQAHRLIQNNLICPEDSNAFAKVCEEEDNYK